MLGPTDMLEELPTKLNEFTAIYTCFQRIPASQSVRIINLNSMLYYIGCKMVSPWLREMSGGNTALWIYIVEHDEN